MPARRVALRARLCSLRSPRCRWPAACSARATARHVVRFWAMGREGEVVARAACRSSSARIPGIRVEVQQLPWSAAHEKLLTAFAGDVDARRLPARQHLDPGVRGARRARSRSTRDVAAIARSIRPTTTSPASGTPTSSTARSTACRGTSTRGSCSIAATCLRRPASTPPPRTWAEWRAALRRDQAARRGPSATRSCCR